MKLATICLAVAAAMAFAPGCEKDEPDVPIEADADTSSPGAGAALVVYSRTGGVAGISELLAVTDDGSATLELGHGSETTSTGFDLTSAELSRLRGAVQTAHLEPGPAPPSGCNDCFHYEITVGAKTTGFDQTQVPEQAEELVAMLGQLVEDHIPARASAARG
jgi:hypothetical protein